MTRGPEHIEHGAVGLLPRLTQGGHVFRQQPALQEHGGGIATRVRLDHLPDLNGVVGQEVVEHHLTGVAEHGVGVVPIAEEAEHVAVVVEELFEGVVLLIWPHCLHALIHLEVERAYD